MQSSSSRAQEERRNQELIRKKIETLKAQLKDVPGDSPPSKSLLTSPKRKRPEPTQLVPPTPSPKKRKVDHGSGTKWTKSRVLPLRRPTMYGASTSGRDTPDVKFSKPAASNVLNKLASLNNRPVDASSTQVVARSSAFTERPLHNEDVYTAPKRDDRLALVEDLEPGPADHTPSFDDPEFELLEPNSGIRLSSRSVSHEDLQEYLSARYYLPPSRLYSAIRLLPDKQGYDVPVPGDWITIAVVAERGPIKFSKAPIAVGIEEDGNGVEKQEDSKRKGKGKEAPQKPTGKKYVNLKLIDFGARSRSSSSASGGKAVIRGDAFLSLLLFESDRFDEVADEGGGKPKKVYKGGSRGAFEAMSKLKEGDLIALLNPRVLKPFQRSNDSPHPTNNILALTPESASSILVIGRARDLGMCSVVKKDGKVCGSWCDKRVSDVCEWHIQNAVERRRAGRAEFSIGTTGMSMTSAPRRKPNYDPVRQWGLKPADAESGGSGGSTYVVSGHIVSGSGLDSRSLYATENMGREGQAKAKRISSKDADRALKGLLERDKEGMKAVMKAREVGRMHKDLVSGVRKGEDGEMRENKISKHKGSDDGAVGCPAKEYTGKNAYSADVIKQLGFDPIMKAGQRRGEDSNIQKKLEVLATVQAARKGRVLGPKPGEKIRSGVIAPARPDFKASGTKESRDPDGLDDHPSTDTRMIDLDDSE